MSSAGDRQHGSAGALRPALGLVVGGCRLDELLARGGMGTVYRAKQLTLGREVAVKLVPALGADKGLVERFRREATSAAALEHPHVLPVYWAGEEAGLLFLVMRLVHGPDLGALVAREGPLEPGRAVALIDQVADALDAAHRAGLVHRDVKPANVLVEQRSGPEHAYLADFGLMRRVVGENELTRTGEWVGTVDYMAPEQLEGAAVDRRADVYALTGVLYTLLSGERPYPREDIVSSAWAHVNAEPPRLPGNDAVNAVIARGMAKRPEERYESAGELAAAARAVLAPGSEGPTRTGARSPHRPPAMRTYRSSAISRRALALVVVALAVAVGGIATAIALSSRSSNAPEYVSNTYRFSYPAGWSLVENDAPVGGFRRTRLISPDGSQTLIVDRTPGDPLSPAAKAVAVERPTSSTPGYRRVSLYPATFGGRPAFVWKFTLAGQPQGARVDIFERIGMNGYAILGEASQLSAIEPVAYGAAQSLQAR